MLQALALTKQSTHLDGNDSGVPDLYFNAGLLAAHPAGRTQVSRKHGGPVLAPHLHTERVR
jgi:hypothetical protein